MTVTYSVTLFAFIGSTESSLMKRLFITLHLSGLVDIFCTMIVNLMIMMTTGTDSFIYFSKHSVKNHKDKQPDKNIGTNSNITPSGNQIHDRWYLDA